MPAQGTGTVGQLRAIVAPEKGILHKADATGRCQWCSQPVDGFFDPAADELVGEDKEYIGPLSAWNTSSTFVECAWV